MSRKRTIKREHVGAKNTARFILTVFLIVIQSYMFYDTWVHKYNVILRFPYLGRGNVFLAIIYGILLYVFLLTLGADRLGNFKISTIIFSCGLATIFTNAITYVAIIVPAIARGFVNPDDMVYLTLWQFGVVFIWGIVSKFIYKKLFPPCDALLIYGSYAPDRLLAKFGEREDVCDIVKTVNYQNTSENDIIDMISKYDAIVIGDIPAEKRNDFLKVCYASYKQTYLVPKISDIVVMFSEQTYLFDSPLFFVRNSNSTPDVQILKRLFDILLSLIGLVIFSPLIIIFSILIKLEDGGKIFFVQERVKEGDDTFDIIKFRSMKESKKDEVIPATKDDDRITKVGRFMRNWRIDEIPQLINVLKGDMSIVGPRPERKEHVEIYSRDIPEFKYRHRVKAGLTGLAQVYGKYNTTAYDKLKLDLIYIQNFSLILDLKIILRTIQILFKKESSEGFTNEDSKRITDQA